MLYLIRNISKIYNIPFLTVDFPVINSSQPCVNAEQYTACFVILWEMLYIFLFGLIFDNILGVCASRNLSNRLLN